MTAILYQRPDGGVSVLYPLAWENARGPAVDRFMEWCAENGVPPDASADTMRAHWLAFVQEKDIPADAVAVKVVEAADIPGDRTFRSALTMDLTHDMVKAKALWRDKIRAARAPKLAALDVQYQRADEQSDAAGKVRIIAEKKALRDATADTAIDRAATCDELKAVWPAALKD